MKKYLILINAFSLIATTTLTITACAEKPMLYASNTVNHELDFWSTKTSGIVKSLIMSKEIKSDTCQTIKDFLLEFNNSETENIDLNLKSWSEFCDIWGFNKKININASFNPKEYFVPNNTGILTKGIKESKAIKKIFQELTFIFENQNINNKLLYNLLIKDPNTKKLIISYLNQLKEINPVSPEKEKLNHFYNYFLKIIKETVTGSNTQENNNEENQKKNFEETIKSLESLFNYLIKGQWSEKQKTTPQNQKEFQNFMDDWKDDEGKPYSILNKNGKWNHSIFSNTKNWNENDYNLYRGIALINHLIYKIGKDYQIKKPDDTEYKGRYLGQILRSHFSFLPYPKFNFEKFKEDIQQYLPHLLQNPKYIFTLIEGLIPIIKQLILEDNNTQEITSLKIDSLINTLEKIEDILDNPEKIIKIVEKLFDSTILKEIVSDFPYFTSKIIKMINNSKSWKNWNSWKDWFSSWKHGNSNNSGFKYSFISEFLKEKISFIKKENHLNHAIKHIHELLTYLKDKKDYEEIKLADIQELLIGKEGILPKFKDTVIPILYNIFVSKEKITDKEYEALFEAFGGQLPEKNKEITQKVKENSFFNFIAKLLEEKQKNIEIKSAGFLSKIYLWVLQSLNSEATDLENWIQRNYKAYFDIKNQSRSKISNVTMATKQQNNKILYILSYDLKYQIKENTYNFFIKCQSDDNLELSNKAKNFYFTDIKLTNLKK